jgi:hypothetical protein
MRGTVFGVGACWVLAAAIGTSLGDEWATIRGRIVYDGTPPVPKRMVVDKDVEVCGEKELIDESLLVHPDNRGVKNVVVQLALGRGETVDIHPDYEQSAQAEVLLDSKYCRFVPHVTVMRTTQTLVISNSDPIGDNVKIDVLRNPPINVTLPAGVTHTQRFPVAERLPARVTCAIHPWELGWLVVIDHPYVAVSDEEGRFEIRNVPVGTRKFMFWHETAGYVSEVAVRGQKENWPRGVHAWDLQPGDNDVGEIIVAPELFKS